MSGPVTVDTFNGSADSPGSFNVLGRLGVARREGANGFSFAVTNGGAGLTDVVEATTNLSPPTAWQAVATNVALASGAWRYTNESTALFPRHFFRVRIQ